MLTVEQTISAATRVLFGKPLVTNVYRAVIVEAIVDAALSDWSWCSADYASCDFKHPDGRRLEVKQSALKQSWESARVSVPSWDIKPRTGYWKDGVEWISQPGRNADIYVFALHTVTDDTADHRDSYQWVFYVVPTKALPNTKRLSLAALKKIAQPVPVQQLAQSVETHTALGF